MNILFHPCSRLTVSIFRRIALRTVVSFVSVDDKEGKWESNSAIHENARPVVEMKSKEPSQQESSGCSLSPIYLDLQATTPMVRDLHMRGKEIMYEKILRN